MKHATGRMVTKFPLCVHYFWSTLYICRNLLSNKSLSVTCWHITSERM